jgi:hypothetical protein
VLHGGSRGTVLSTSGTQSLAQLPEFYRNRKALMPGRPRQQRQHMRVEFLLRPFNGGTESMIGQRAVSDSDMLRSNLSGRRRAQRLS